MPIHAQQRQGCTEQRDGRTCCSMFALQGPSGPWEKEGAASEPPASSHYLVCLPWKMEDTTFDIKGLYGDLGLAYVGVQVSFMASLGHSKGLTELGTPLLLPARDQPKGLRISRHALLQLLRR